MNSGQGDAGLENAPWYQRVDGQRNQTRLPAVVVADRPGVDGAKPEDHENGQGDGDHDERR